MADRTQSTGLLGTNQQCWDLASQGQNSDGKYVPGGLREDLVTM